MPIGINIQTVTSPKYICPDRGYTRAAGFTVFNSDFGDGYTQKFKQSINNRSEVLNLKFENRPAREINALFRFFRRYKGLDPFPYRVPISETSEKVIACICKDYSIEWTTNTIGTLTAQLIQVDESPLFIDVQPYVGEGYITDSYVGLG